MFAADRSAAGGVLDRWAVDPDSFWVRRAAMLALLVPLRTSDEDWDRFCGYAAALVGDEAIRKGLMSFLESTEWPQAAAEYRLLLFVTAGSANGSDKQVLDPEVIRAELARGGELGMGQVLRLRIRHFTEGVFLGSKEFVNEMFARHRDRFGSKRKDGARPIRGVPLPGISVLRDLRVNAIG